MRLTILAALLAMCAATACDDTTYSTPGGGVDDASPGDRPDAGGRTPDGGPSGRDTGGPIVEPSECTQDRDCPDFAWCADGECVSNNGAPCQGDNDCRQGDICVRGSCEPSPGCRSDRECPGGYCDNGACVDAPGIAYRFVLLQDVTSPASGDFPGADIDAIELLKANGSVHWVSAVEDAYIGVNGNSAPDVNQLLGPSDSNCDADSGAFVSLGGLDQGGYVIVSYGTAREDVILENGDRIHVYELGASLCGQFDDDHVEIILGFGNTLGSFLEEGHRIGRTSAGNFEIEITGL